MKSVTHFFSWRDLGRFLALVVCVSSCLTLRAVGQSKTDLEGSWIGEHSLLGDAKRVFKPGEMTMKFAGTRLLAVGFTTPTETEVAFTIDPNQSPKHFDYVKAGSTVKCIYEVRGDVLTIAVPRGTLARPTSFTPDEKKSAIILVLKRQK
jgi:uncharacterized protein (TIGR03067 family)